MKKEGKTKQNKVEISVEYQCDNSLPEATKESTGLTASEMTGSEQYESSKMMKQTT